jgi:glycosyltransferase involved in cell wall biosynthesis
MISEAEMRLLTERFNVPSEIIHYIPFFRPIPDDGQWLDFEERQHFVSIGNFRHEPNWDAVRYLKESIWPAIRKKLPEAELHVYGAYPPKKATQLHNEKQGFLVKGWAQDAYEVVSNARVLLAPLRFGAGLKGKLVDAAECGTPAVTSSIGAEGMYQNHIPVLIEDTADAFAECAVSLYQSPERWKTLQDECLPMIKERFDEAHHIQQFVNRLADQEQNLTQYRLTNFTGAMLRHHSMKSTQYMSQWIEAKNKL